jgi:hypothetical protein
MTATTRSKRHSRPVIRNILIHVGIEQNLWNVTGDCTRPLREVPWRIHQCPFDDHTAKTYSAVLSINDPHGSAGAAK